MSIYIKNVSEPWFSLIKSGEKTIEGRLNKGDFSNMKTGDIITFTNNEFKENRSFNVKIIKISKYETFQLYLENEGIKNCLPGIDTIEKGVNIYHEFYTKSDEIQYKVIAITFEIVIL